VTAPPARAGDALPRGNGPSGLSPAEPGETASVMSHAEKLTIEKAQHELLNWSMQGCTATVKEAAKFLKPLTIEQLVQMHKGLGENYNTRVEQVYAVETDDDDYEGVFCPSDEDAAGAVEEMHDALKARSLISYELYLREEKAKKTRTLSLHKKTIPAKNKKAA